MEDCFTAQVMRKYSARYMFCQQCGFLAVREPFWLEEAYKNAITHADTGLVMRNNSIALKVASVLYFLTGERGGGKYFDAAGGYGLFTRLMRDFGFDFYWMDKYCENLISPGFEYEQDLFECKGVTAFEVLEHLITPFSFFEETFSMSGAQFCIFSTDLYRNTPPLPEEWYYYTFATGQHIAFYQRRTLETLGAKLGLYFASANGLHIYSKTHINELKLRFVTGWITDVSTLWIRSHMRSKTVSDHQLMMDRTL